MLNLGKYEISIEKNASKCNDDGEVSDSPHPRQFGNKSKNKFITVGSSCSHMIIRSPLCKNIYECYEKFSEINNVVLCVLHDKGELLNLFSDHCEANLISNISVRFLINKCFYEEMLCHDGSLPKCLNMAYEKIAKNFNKRLNLLDNVFGKVNIDVAQDGITIFVDGTDFEDKCGFSCNDLGFLVVFIFSCLYDFNVTEGINNYFDNINYTNDIFHLGLDECISEIYKKVKTQSTYIQTFCNLSDKFQHILKLERKYSDDAYNLRYSLNNGQKLVAESIALIKDAICRGVDYEIINYEKNIVKFYNNGKSAIIVEGNKTDKDSYIFPFVTDDKFYAKSVLKENGLNTPEGILIHKSTCKEDLKLIVDEFANKPVVIKPRDTNFGIGITVYPNGTRYETLIDAINYAFGFDDSVIIEEYIKGMEYRFLIINGKCISVAYRRGASVIGNGELTIRQLIDIKNKEPWHALTGTPVKSDEPVVEFLKLQGLSLNSIPKDGERIFLRKNSNCCTGGESIVITHQMPNIFKEYAEKASRAFNAKICGIDMIIDDINSNEYSIIEVNDMPGYSINEWPYEGKGEQVGVEVLKLVGLI